jgi:hypothetical protein
VIARLRRVHYGIHRILWLPIALLFLAALTSRPSSELRNEGQDVLLGSELPLGTKSDATPGPRALVGSSLDAFGPWPARVALFGDGTLELTPLRPLDRPELLVYWLPGTQVGDALPDSAQLLGRLAGTQVQRFRLPPRATASTSGRGSLVVYSLGHQAIVAVAPLSSIGDSGNPSAAGKGGA